MNSLKLNQVGYLAIIKIVPIYNRVINMQNICYLLWKVIIRVRIENRNRKDQETTSNIKFVKFFSFICLLQTTQNYIFLYIVKVY